MTNSAELLSLLTEAFDTGVRINLYSARVLADDVSDKEFDVMVGKLEISGAIVMMTYNEPRERKAAQAKDRYYADSIGKEIFYIA